METYCLYWIHYPEQTNPSSEGYIGITKNFDQRVKTHSKYTKYKHIKNRIDSGAIIDVLVENLTEESAKTLEEQYRPHDNIGWNLTKGGGIPPSRVGKVSAKSLLVGDDRTEAQKEAAKKHKERMQGKLPVNTTPVVVFGKEFKSANQAMRELELSTSQYYFYKNNKNLKFDTPEELKNYTKKIKSEKLSGKNNYMYGKKLSAETVAKRTASLKRNKLAKKLAAKELLNDNDNN